MKVKLHNPIHYYSSMSQQQKSPVKTPAKSPANTPAKSFADTAAGAVASKAMKEREAALSKISEVREEALKRKAAGDPREAEDIFVALMKNRGGTIEKYGSVLCSLQGNVTAKAKQLWSVLPPLDQEEEDEEEGDDADEKIPSPEVSDGEKEGIMLSHRMLGDLLRKAAREAADATAAAIDEKLKAGESRRAVPQIQRQVREESFSGGDSDSSRSSEGSRHGGGGREPSSDAAERTRLFLLEHSDFGEMPNGLSRQQKQQNRRRFPVVKEDLPRVPELGKVANLKKEVQEQDKRFAKEQRNLLELLPPLVHALTAESLEEARTACEGVLQIWQGAFGAIKSRRRELVIKALAPSTVAKFVKSADKAEPLIPPEELEDILRSKHIHDKATSSRAGGGSFRSNGPKERKRSRSRGPKEQQKGGGYQPSCFQRSGKSNKYPKPDRKGKGKADESDD